MHLRERLRQLHADHHDGKIDKVERHWHDDNPAVRGRARLILMEVGIAAVLSGLIYLGTRERARRRVAAVLEDPFSVSPSEAYRVWDKLNKRGKGENLPMSFLSSIDRRGAEDYEEVRKKIGQIEPCHPLNRLFFTEETRQNTFLEPKIDEKCLAYVGSFTPKGQELANLFFDKIKKPRLIDNP